MRNSKDGQGNAMSDALIACVDGSLDADGAATAAGVPPLSIAHSQKVYAPHYWFAASGTSPTLFGRRRFAVDCLVDALSGLAATADPFEVSKQTVDGLVLRISVSERDAERAAKRRTLTNLAREFKTLADFGIELETRGLIYKPCWVLQHADERLLVDALTGAWYSLPHASAARAVAPG